MSAEQVAVVRLLVTPEDAASQLSLSRTVIYELIRTGELRSVKVGRARRIPADALDDFVTSLLADPDGVRGAS